MSVTKEEEESLTHKLEIQTVLNHYLTGRIEKKRKERKKGKPLRVLGSLEHLHAALTVTQQHVSAQAILLWTLVGVLTALILKSFTASSSEFYFLPRKPFSSEVKRCVV